MSFNSFLQKIRNSSEYRGQIAYVSDFFETGETQPLVGKLEANRYPEIDLVLDSARNLFGSESLFQHQSGAQVTFAYLPEFKDKYSIFMFVSFILI